MKYFQLRPHNEEAKLSSHKYVSKTESSKDLNIMDISQFTAAAACSFLRPITITSLNFIRQVLVASL